MQTSSHRRFTGLDINSNPLAQNPYKELGSGARSATVIADNTDLQGAGKLSNRKGFDYFTNATVSTVTAMFEYNNYLIQHQNGNTSLFRGDNATGTRTQYGGSYTAPTGYRMDFTLARGSMFFTTTGAPYKLDALTNTPVRSGLTKGLDTRGTTTGSNGFMSGFSKVGYHVTWSRTDANNQLVRSDTGAKLVVTNNTRVTITSATQSLGTATITTSSAHGFTTADQILISGVTPTNYNGTYTITVTGSTTFTYTVAGSPGSGTVFGTAEKQMNVQLTFPAPWDALATDSYEIWRTVTTSASASDPGDTCFLVVSAVYGGAAGGTVTYTDSTSDATIQISTPLYTNSTQEGATAGNSRPPMCSSLANYKDYAIFGNTSVDHQITIDLLSVGSLVSGTSKVLIAQTSGGGTRQYTAGAAENSATQTFLLVTTNPSPSLNIQQTMQSFCRVVNQDSGGFWYAEYTSLSNPNYNPGIVRLWARSPMTGAFALTADSGTTGSQFSPVLPTSGSTIASSNDARPNRLFYSKQYAPDHVPLVNFIDVGSLTEPIQRVIASRDALYILKTDGVWFISGYSLPNTPTQLDATCHIVAPASAAQVNNQIYALTNQGVCQISTSGVTVISFDIEPAIAPLLTNTNISTVTHGIGHESERKYILYLPTVNSDTYGTQAYVYHTFLQSWVRWTIPAAAGLALSSNYKLYLSSGYEKAVLQQRKSNTNADYCDQSQPVTITGQSGTVVTLTWSNTLFTPTAGVSLTQSTSFAKVISVVNTSGNTWQFTLDRSTVTYSNGAATAQMPIYAHVRCAPDVCGDSGVVKTFYNATINLAANTVTQATVEIGTNEGPQLYTYTITRANTGGWGQNAWGDTAWGDPTNAVSTIPFSVDCPVPDNSGETLTIGWIHNVSNEPFTLVQASIFFDTNAEYEVIQ